MRLCGCGCGLFTNEYRPGLFRDYRRGHSNHLKTMPITERLIKYTDVLPGTDCLLWVGVIDKYGYGKLTVKGKNKFVHRLMYELCTGEIPAGMTIDHLCRTKNCINPSHLEVVTAAENKSRGKKARCLRGHEYTPENTKKEPRGRSCRTCNRMNDARRRADAASQARV